MIKEIEELTQKGVSFVEQVDFLEQSTIVYERTKIKEALTHLKKRFEVLMDLTAVDYVAPKKHTKVIYFLHDPTTFERLRVAAFVERDQTLPTVIDLWAGAKWYEREIFDLFGVVFAGHVGLKRLLMPDDWKGHPLRRDYPLTEEAVEFKNGIKPKLPSQIIPHFFDKRAGKST